MSKYSSTVGLGIFVGSYIIIMYLAFSQPFTNPLFIVPGIMGLVWLIMSNFEYTAMVFSNPNFLCLDGTIGTVIDIIEDKPGRETYIVSTKARYIPSNMRENIGGIKGFFSRLSLQENIEVSDIGELFVHPSRNECGAPEGAVIYLGSITKKSVPSLNQHLINKIRLMSNSISINETLNEEYKALATILSQSSNTDILQSSQRISALLKDINDSQVPRQAMYGGRGNDE